MNSSLDTRTRRNTSLPGYFSTLLHTKTQDSFNPATLGILKKCPDYRGWLHFRRPSKYKFQTRGARFHCSITAPPYYGRVISRSQGVRYSEVSLLCTNGHSYTVPANGSSGICDILTRGARFHCSMAAVCAAIYLKIALMITRVVFAVFMSFSFRSFSMHLFSPWIILAFHRGWEGCGCRG